MRRRLKKTKHSSRQKTPQLPLLSITTRALLSSGGVTSAASVTSMALGLKTLNVPHTLPVCFPSHRFLKFASQNIVVTGSVFPLFLDADGPAGVQIS